jgi:hypothetical protein
VAQSHWHSIDAWKSQLKLMIPLSVLTLWGLDLDCSSIGSEADHEVADLNEKASQCRTNVRLIFSGKSSELPALCVFWCIYARSYPQLISFSNSISMNKLFMMCDHIWSLLYIYVHISWIILYQYHHQWLCIYIYNPLNDVSIHLVFAVPGRRRLKRLRTMGLHWNW